MYSCDKSRVMFTFRCIRRFSVRVIRMIRMAMDTPGTVAIHAINTRKGAKLSHVCLLSTLLFPNNRFDSYVYDIYIYMAFWLLNPPNYGLLCSRSHPPSSYVRGKERSRGDESHYRQDSRYGELFADELRSCTSTVISR